MTSAVSHRWLHRFAWLTAVCTVLLPVTTGAVVTTVDAGMAFPDWLTSDGHFMLVYPWLKSTGDKFIEHGHRLAAVTVGCLTLALLAVGFSAQTGPGVRAVVAAILVGVIAQGVLGGQRVIQDERLLALLHGDFAACVFCLMGLLVAMTGSRWSQPSENLPPGAVPAWAWSLVAFALLAVQYVLGGLLRHLGSAHAWLVHPWFALAVAAAAAAFFVAAWRTGSSELRRAAGWVLGLVIAQALLGVATWAVRYGFPQFHIVAVQQSPWQIAARSLHKVLGLVTFMAAFVAVVRCGRTAKISLAWPRSVSVTAMGGAA